MGNSCATSRTIAGKELRGYFASPVAWVMMALFAVIFGLLLHRATSNCVRAAEHAGAAVRRPPRERQPAT